MAVQGESPAGRGQWLAGVEAVGLGHLGGIDAMSAPTDVASLIGAFLYSSSASMAVSTISSPHPFRPSGRVALPLSLAHLRSSSLPSLGFSISRFAPGWNRKGAGTPVCVGVVVRGWEPRDAQIS